MRKLGLYLFLVIILISIFGIGVASAANKTATEVWTLYSMDSIDAYNLWREFGMLLSQYLAEWGVVLK